MARGLARLVDGDRVELDATTGTLAVLVDAREGEQRQISPAPERVHNLGRNLFEIFRSNNSGAAKGASIFDSAFS